MQITYYPYAIYKPSQYSSIIYALRLSDTFQNCGRHLVDFNANTAKGYCESSLICLKPSFVLGLIFSTIRPSAMYERCAIITAFIIHSVGLVEWVYRINRS